jgi:predicted MPP superfamily phosphohydrolase
MRQVSRFHNRALWDDQARWRRAVWRVMAHTGLTGFHSLPIHQSWVEMPTFPMPLHNLSDEHAGLTLVQISDLHSSPFVRDHYLRQHIEWINEVKPDIVVATGDLFMGGYRYADRVASLLARLKASLGVACILGNHDYGLSGGDRSLRGVRRAEYAQRAMQARGIIVLRNQVWTLRPATGAPLRVVGIDDDWSGHMDAAAAFAGVPEREPCICLLHNPARVGDIMEYPWQWTLSGHTHGRQIATSVLGQAFYPKRFRHYTHGLYTINGRCLYVNRGLSYGKRAHDWCRPEITVFKLEATRAVTPAKAIEKQAGVPVKSRLRPLTPAGDSA